MTTMQKAVGAIVLGLLLAGCADTRATTEPRTVSLAKQKVRTPVSAFGADVPLAYYELSLDFSKRTAGFTPPV